MAGRRLGQVFVDLGFIDDDQLEMLVEEQQQQPGQLIGRVAEQMGLITDTQLAQALAEQMHLQVVDLGDVELSAEVLNEISETMAQMYQVVPIQLVENRLTVATHSPQNITIADELRTFLGREIELVVATEREINSLVGQYFDSQQESIEKIVADLEADEGEEGGGKKKRSHRPSLGRLPASRLEYWRPKLEGNVRRDGERDAALVALGWRLIVVWECELKGATAVAQVAARVADAVEHKD